MGRGGERWREVEMKRGEAAVALSSPEVEGEDMLEIGKRRSAF